jgi:hypothetical protein
MESRPGRRAHGSTSRTAGPDSSRSSWKVIQGLAQGSTLIATGSYLGHSTKGTPGARGSEAVARVAIEKVLVGDAALAKTTFEVVHTASDQPFDSAENKRLLFFFAKDGARWSPVLYRTHGVITLDGDKVKLWLEGKARGDHYTLDEVMAKVRALPSATVRWTATIAKAPKRSSGFIEASFTAKNTGSAPVKVMPPSFYFDAVTAYPLTNGVWDQRVGWWTGVDHWSFAKESLVTVGAGAERTFAYEIPLTALGMKDVREYDVYMRLEAHRTTDEADAALQGIDPTTVWLAGLREQKVTIRLDP